MIDVECMVKSLRLAGLRGIFNGINVPWKSFLQHFLSPLGGLFFLLAITTYLIIHDSFSILFELLSWWTEFRQTFATEKDWTNIIWNNCEVRIDNKPVHYKNYYEAGIVFTQDLLFNLNVADTYSHLSNKINQTNILQIFYILQRS